MNLDLSGKTVLVTGASSGIGAASALLFAGEGADVIVAYHRGAERAEAVAAQARQLGVRAWALELDHADPSSAARAAEWVRAATGGLDSLVLCAGQNVITPFEQISPDEWRQVLDVNLTGPFALAQALAPLLRDGSTIVTVASVAAQTGNAAHIHYAAAKAGLVNLTKSLARALAPRVRVNCVAPGITLTPMGEDTVKNSLPPTYARDKLLLRRYAAPEEIARWIVFVASPASGFMTGATVDVNGGRDLR